MAPTWSGRLNQLTAPLERMAQAIASARPESSLDRIVDSLHQTSLPASVLLNLEEAAAEIAAASIVKPDRNHAMVVSIPLPTHLAARFPGTENNNGHEPHLTLCFVTAKHVSSGVLSEILATLRRVGKKIAPFRVGLSCAAGLQDFGKGGDGSKALWFPARDDPDGALVSLHKLIRQALLLEGLPCDHHNTFVPHVTWSYVPNDQSEVDRQRMSALAASRFNDVSTWFDVRHLMLSTPDGSSPKTIALTPHIRKPSTVGRSFMED